MRFLVKYVEYLLGRDLVTTHIENKVGVLRQMLDRLFRDVL